MPALPAEATDVRIVRHAGCSSKPWWLTPGSRPSLFCAGAPKWRRAWLAGLAPRPQRWRWRRGHLCACAGELPPAAVLQHVAGHSRLIHRCRACQPACRASPASPGTQPLQARSSCPSPLCVDTFGRGPHLRPRALWQWRRREQHRLRPRARQHRQRRLADRGHRERPWGLYHRTDLSGRLPRAWGQPGA